MTLRTTVVAALLLVAGLSLVTAESTHRHLSPKFVSAVDAERYPSARGPKTPPVLKWNFSTKTDYRYKLEHTSESIIGRLDDDEKTLPNNKTTAIGDLVVRSLGDGTARIVLENIKTKLSVSGEDGTHDVTHDMPTAVVTGLHEDGTLESSPAAQQALVRLLFPLPLKPLDVGEATELPIEVPVNAMGSPLQAKGVTRVVNVGWVMVGKRLCVELRGTTTFSPLKVPEEIAGKYEYGMAARSVFFFDPSEQRFVRGVLAMNTSFAADVPSPLPTIDGDKPTAAPERFRMSMVSEDLVTISAD